MSVLKDGDNDGAEPISAEVVHEALEFIDLLPLDVTMPDAIPEPSGYIRLAMAKIKGPDTTTENYTRRCGIIRFHFWKKTKDADIYSSFD